MATDIQVNSNQSFASLTSYKSYVALLNQENTDAPVATVMNDSDSNYLGDIVWTRDSAGLYVGTLTGELPASKTVILTGNCGQVIDAASNVSPNSIYIGSKELATGFAYSDDLLINFPVEIRVYPL